MKTILRKSTIILASLLAGFTTAHAHSDAFEPEFVDTLVEPYLEIQQALAADKLMEARTGAKEFAAAAKQGPSEAVAPEIIRITTAVDGIGSSDEISEARAAFLALSKEMQSLVEHVGTTNQRNLRVVHCPMAFGGEGGDWIQEDTTVSNPYYGPRMLRCGSVQKQIAEKNPA